MGRVFYKDAKGAYTEEDRVCIGLMGYAGRSATDCVRPVESGEAILWLKGALESLAYRLHTPPMTMKATDIEGFDKGCAAVIIIAGRPAGVIGLINSDVRKKRRIMSPLVIAELKRSVLLTNAFKVVNAKDVPMFPATTRDIALISGAGVTHEQLVQVMKKAGPAELTGITLFDIFKDKKLNGRTSLAYSLEFRSPERTLKDDEVNAALDKIKAALKAKLQVEIRGE